MKAVYSTLLEIALALRHMHSLHLVHCDLKPQNVLLKSSPRDPRGFTAKLSDFGLSKMLEADEEGQLVIDDGIQSGTITHLPPEVLQGRRQLGPAVDIYAFGIVMFQMLCGMTVYRGLDMKQVIRGVVRHGLRPIFPSWVPHEYRDLAQRCWQVQPSLRPASLQLVAELESLLQATQQAAVAMGRGGGDGASLASLLTTTASSNAIKAAAAAAAAPTLQAAPAAAPVGAATIATTMTTTTDGIQAGPAAGAGGNGGGGGSVAAADRNAPYIVYQPPQQLYRPATTGGATRRATATGTVPTGSV
ncbi:hypothetical protein Agub_g6108 [Astrephomene gubernaculifera]|uniref:Protein kinase domain-containing protein n=1 Tax=Astrephomene gubernaculifera TaxID=47775 RepID=A0AAD3DRV2_9CHLO|nr:hypothetical protein Agub_g6108 [Astrephomene gubernaculifera]